MLSHTGEEGDLATNDIYWDKVLEIASVGHREVSDFSENKGDPVVVQGVLVQSPGT